MSDDQESAVSLSLTAPTGTFIKAWDFLKEIVADRPQQNINPMARAIKEVDTYLGT